MRKYVRALIARRGPEATDEFIAVQVNRLNEALRKSYGAMSEKDLATVDRVVRIVRELGRYHGFCGGAHGTERRRKPLETLDSGAGMAAVGSFPRAAPQRARAQALAEEDRGEDAAEAALIPNWEFLADLNPQGQEEGTEQRRNLLKSLNSRTEMARVASLLAEEGRSEEWEAEADVPPDLAEFLARLLTAEESGGEGDPNGVTGVDFRAPLWGGIAEWRRDPERSLEES
jgi:hypothetical protein